MFQGNGVDGTVFEVQLSCLQAALYHAASEVDYLRDSPSLEKAQATFVSLTTTLMHIFEKLEAFKDAQEAEKAQLFKTRPRIQSFQTNEEIEEASYQSMFPNHAADFADLEMLEIDEIPPSKAVEAQIQTSKSKALMEGALLNEIVLLHRNVYLNTHPIDSDHKIRYKVGQMLFQMMNRVVDRSFDDATMTGNVLDVFFPLEGSSKVICLSFWKNFNVFQRNLRFIQSGRCFSMSKSLVWKRFR